MNCISNKLTGISGKSVFTIAFIIIFSIALIPAGCSSGADVDAEEDFLKKYEAAPEENNERAVLKFYFPGQQPKAWDEVRAEIEKELADTVNVSLDFKWLENQSYIQKMNTLTASDDSFDAFCVAKPQQYYLDFTKLVREGKLKDITQLFRESAPALFQKYTEEELDYARVDGKLFAVPSLYPCAYCTYLMADDALLKKYSLPDISSFDQYEAYLKTVKENEPELIPGTIANSVDTLNLFARASGYVVVDEPQKLVYKWDDPKMKIVAWENTPEFKEAVNYIASWFKKGYLVSNPDQLKTTSFIYFGTLTPPSNETTKMTFSNSSGTMGESNPLRVFYFCPEKTVQRDNAMGTVYRNGSFVFPAASANTGKALQFLEWVQQSQSNYYLIMYGREGKDYVLKNNYPLLPEGMEYKDSTYMYWDGHWAFENIEFLPAVKDEKGNEFNYRDFIDKNSKYPPHGAFYPNYSTIESAAENRSKVFQDFERKIKRGELVDSSQVDSFIKSLEDLGSVNLVEIVQKQLDEAVDGRK